MTNESIKSAKPVSYFCVLSYNLLRNYAKVIPFDCAACFLDGKTFVDAVLLALGTFVGFCKDGTVRIYHEICIRTTIIKYGSNIT